MAVRAGAARPAESVQIDVVSGLYLLTKRLERSKPLWPPLVKPAPWGFRTRT